MRAAPAGGGWRLRVGVMQRTTAEEPETVVRHTGRGGCSAHHRRATWRPPPLGSHSATLRHSWRQRPPLTISTGAPLRRRAGSSCTPAHVTTNNGPTHRSRRRTPSAADRGGGSPLTGAHRVPPPPPLSLPPRTTAADTAAPPPPAPPQQRYIPPPRSHHDPRPLLASPRRQRPTRIDATGLHVSDEQVGVVGCERGGNGADPTGGAGARP